VNLTDGEVSSKCSDIFIDCEKLDAVRIISGQLRSSRYHFSETARQATPGDVGPCHGNAS
jgi:hypothetical protein